MKIDIMVIEDSRPTLGSLVDYLEKDAEINIVDTAIDGVEAMQKLRELKPDIALLDLMLPNKDGMAILETLSEEKLIKNPTHYVVLTAMASEDVTKKLFRLGVDYIMIKPYDVTDLLRRIKEIDLNDNIVCDYDFATDHSTRIEKKICSVLNEVGVMPGLKGYSYLKSSILLGYKDESMLESITKTLYPAVAKEYLASPTRVERAVRHAIELAWEKGDAVAAYENMGFFIFSQDRRPTNGEFIHAIVEYLKMIM